MPVPERRRSLFGEEENRFWYADEVRNAKSGKKEFSVISGKIPCFDVQIVIIPVIGWRYPIT